MEEQSHEEYGKQVIEKALNGTRVFWKGSDTTLSGSNSKVEIKDAQIDGLIGKNVVVEIEAGGKKKYRAAIIDLFLHKRVKKLLVLMTAGQLGKNGDRHDWEKIAELIQRECIGIFNALGMKMGDYGVVVLYGHRSQGNKHIDTLDSDVTKVQEALKELSEA